VNIEVKIRLGNVSGQLSVVSGRARAAGWPVAERAGAGGTSPCGEWACTKVTIITKITHLSYDGSRGKYGLLHESNDNSTNLTSGFVHDNGLTRSRSFGPRGLLASPRLLSPPPRRLKSTNLSTGERGEGRGSREEREIHKICNVIFPGSGRFRKLKHIFDRN
jgi:hypothetical protein